MQKLSRKGWLCKTWEGELQISNIPGSAPVLFHFTVRDDAIARAVQETEGKQVALTFEQHPGIPLSCFGDTEYFISAVRTAFAAAWVPDASRSRYRAPPVPSAPTGTVPKA